ncbi:Pyrroline-5-carboxylate reductase 3 [Portunus trituberculatus]|uniref:Pyrroline-5-carboxylate reductase 3 n=1 Tax=Portunus trituberculatus TaxID=210409 RepID=A0A5B7DLM5_PORTR|nr:Pyrroline-5-carboxylate reductase 3 [Portunus trituberculatus]
MNFEEHEQRVDHLSISQDTAHLLPGISTKLCPSDFIHETLGGLHDVLALLGRLLHFARQEEAAASRHLQHVKESMKECHSQETLKDVKSTRQLYEAVVTPAHPSSVYPYFTTPCLSNCTVSLQSRRPPPTLALHRPLTHLGHRGGLQEREMCQSGEGVPKWRAAAVEGRAGRQQAAGGATTTNLGSGSDSASCLPPPEPPLVPPRCKDMGKWAKYSKRYKKAWENEADLKEWIVAVEGDNSKAACKFCHNKLRAHHSDLVSHATTVKHKRNAGQGTVVKREAGKAKKGSRGPAKEEAVTVTTLLGLVDPHLIIASAPSDNNLAKLRTLGVRTTHDNNEVVRSSDLVFVCVKPDLLGEMLADLLPLEDEHSPLFVSVVGGVPLATLEELCVFGKASLQVKCVVFVVMLTCPCFGTQMLSSVVENPRVVRSMPNTPSAVGQGCCCEYPMPATSLTTFSVPSPITPPFIHHCLLGKG